MITHDRQEIRIPRRAGTTTWILMSVMREPDCVVIFKSANIAKDAEKTYKQLRKNAPWYLRLKWFFVPQITVPIFSNLETLGHNLDGANRPVILDNSCFC